MKTKSEIKKEAQKLGSQAYENHIPRLPHRDSSLSDLMEKYEEDYTITNLDLISWWIEGWDIGNLNSFDDILK